MKIFVTGGAGFIGGHLATSLLRSGHEVTIYDNLKNSSKGHVSDLIKIGANVVKGDVTNFKLLSKSIRGFDSIVHLAAKIDVQESIKNPEYTHSVNASGTVNLLRACVDNRVHNFVSASSAAVYGDQERQPISENAPTNPISPYGASKLSMEYYMNAFSNCYDLNCISLRFFNVYGQGQSSAYAGVITKFMECIKNDKPLIIFGDGSNTRDFVSVNDVTDAIQIAIKKINGKKGNVYNIGSGRHITIEGLANLMVEISGKKLAIKHSKPKKGDIRSSQPSIVLARRELGFRPKILLRNGLKKLLLD